MLARLPKAALLIAVGLIAASIALEVGLRVMRAGGARVDDLIGSCPNVGPDTPLNHRHNAGRTEQRLGAPDKYGSFAGFAYEEVFDDNGIKRSDLRPQEGRGLRVLFLGDSFIQGYDDATTIPQQAYEWIVAQRALADPPIILNAACSSYSPLIFTVQARQLLPVVRPDFVVVDIDETDLYDDAVRYRKLAEYDEAGRPLRIGRNRDRLALVAACERARQSGSYLWRIAGGWYHQRRIAAFERSAIEGERLFDVAGAPADDLPAPLQAQAEFFSRSLDHLFATLKEYVPADRILVVRHPHLLHLAVDSEGRPAWNRVVGNLVSAAAARNGIAFFDAQDELATQFAGAPERYYWQRDMHFNFDGMRAYGQLVGRELLRKLREASAHPSG